jgi:cysteinylglycine-S-conjugate dipeptidase
MGIRGSVRYPCRRDRLGRGVPFVAEYAAAFPDAPMLITSAGADPYSRTHASDESVERDQLERVAVVAEALLMSALARA